MRKLLLIGVIVPLAASRLALGEDLQPPWWRGRLSTTSQVWEFLAPVDPGLPLPPDGPAVGGQPPLPSTNPS